MGVTVGWHFGTRAIYVWARPSCDRTFQHEVGKLFCNSKATLRLSLPKVNLGTLIFAWDAGLLDISFFSRLFCKAPFISMRSLSVKFAFLPSWP